MSYKEKYLKYKTKYMHLKQLGGGSENDIDTILNNIVKTTILSTRTFQNINLMKALKTGKIILKPKDGLIDAVNNNDSKYILIDDKRKLENIIYHYYLNTQSEQYEEYLIDINKIIREILIYLYTNYKIYIENDIFNDIEGKLQKMSFSKYNMISKN